VFAQVSTEEWNKKVGGFTTRSFGSSKDALTWLRSV
jgi:hypothetical protein